MSTGYSRRGEAIRGGCESGIRDRVGNGAAVAGWSALGYKASDASGRASWDP